MKKTSHQKIQEGFSDLIDNDPKDALGMAVGLLIGVTEALMKAQGEDHTKAIDIQDTGSGRTVTIHKVE